MNELEQEQEQEQEPATRRETPRRKVPIRLSALGLALLVALIVWMGYYYTGAAVHQALTLLSTAGAESKDGIIQLLSVFIQNMVAITAVGGLVGPIGKLCES